MTRAILAAVALSVLCPQPARCQPVDLLKDPGVVREKIKQGGEVYLYNGRPVSAAEAHRMVAGPPRRVGDDKIPDDNALARLTVIGSEAERTAVLADLDKPPLSELKPQLVVKSFPPDHWALRPGFVTTGHPTIYLQSPTGQVLHRQDSYTGAEALFAAIRKAKDYDPKKDPDLNGPLGTLGRVPVSIIPVGLMGAVLAVLALTSRKK